MNPRYYGLVIISLAIISIIWFLGIIMNTKYEGFKSKKVQKDSIGGTQEHMELAYKLCINDSTPHCTRYTSDFENLKKSFHKLKKKFCKKYPKRCRELDIA